MLGIRTLLGLEPKGEVLTSAPDPVVPPWMTSITVESIPGRWGKATVSVKAKEGPVPTIKQLYETVLQRRVEMGEEELAA